MAKTRVYLDLTHLGRHVTGLERISIDLFEKAEFDAADVHPVRARGTLGLIFAQQLWLPLLALLHPRAQFVFPGFPPSPLFSLFARERTLLYVHDLFLLTRRAELSAKARLYMAPAFRLAVGRLKYFLTNSETTRRELAQLVSNEAGIGLYRPEVSNVFGVAPAGPSPARADGEALSILAIGTLEPRKNYPLAAALRDALAAKGHEGTTLAIIGRDGWGGVRQRLAGRPGVTLLGYLDKAEVARRLESAGLFLSTSHDEGLGLPLLEAQYAGLPVAAPDIPVFREVLCASGILFDPTDPERAANVISEALEGPGARERFQAASLANIARWNRAAASDRARVRRLFADGLAAVTAGTGASPRTGEA